MSTGGIVLVALAIAVGLIGIIVPLLPGTLLVYAAIAVWAVLEHRPASWVVLGGVTVVIGASLLIKYLWPVRRMRAADVSGLSLGAGAVLGVIGFFVICRAELVHRRDQRRAWASTVHAVKGVALSVGVELAGALIATAVWIVGLVLTQ